MSVTGIYDVDGMNQGYVKLWRKSLYSSLMRNPNLWMFWCWCLMKASHKPYKTMVGYQTIELQPGQFIFGRKAALKELPLSEKNIRTCMSALVNIENLAIKTTNKYSIVTICNWGLYQSEDDVTGHQTGQQAANKRPTNGHKQECRECKEYNNTPPNPPAPKKSVCVDPARAYRDRYTDEGKRLHEESLDVLHYLNDQAERHLPDNYNGLSVIVDRLHDGYSAESLKQIIDTKLHDPHFQKRRNLYTPETLFKAENIQRYLCETPEDFTGGKPKEKPKPQPEPDFDEEIVI